MAWCGPNIAGRESKPLPANILPSMLQKVLNVTALSSAEVQMLYKRFRKLAPGGYIVIDQFKESLGMLGQVGGSFISERVFTAFDKNGDGKLDFIEFSVALGVMMKGTEDEKLKLAFKMLTSGNRRKGYSKAHDTRIALREDMEHTASSENENKIQKADGYNVYITLEEFSDFVREVDSARVALIGKGIGGVNENVVKSIFLDLAHGPGEGLPVMSFEDFKRGARTSQDFLSLLGLVPQGLAVDVPGSIPASARMTTNFADDSNSPSTTGEAPSSASTQSDLNNIQTEIKGLYDEFMLLIQAFSKVGNKDDNVEVSRKTPASSKTSEIEPSASTQLKKLYKPKEPNVAVSAPNTKVKSADPTSSPTSPPESAKSTAPTKNTGVKSKKTDTVDNGGGTKQVLKKTKSKTTETAAGKAAEKEQQDAKTDNTVDASKIEFLNETNVGESGPSQELTPVQQSGDELNAPDPLNNLDSEAASGAFEKRLKRLSNLVEHLIIENQTASRDPMELSSESGMSTSLTAPHASYGEIGAPHPMLATGSMVPPEIANMSQSDLQEPERMYLNRFLTTRTQRYKKAAPLTRAKSIFKIPERSLTKHQNRGLAVYFGHENWNLVLNMMVGIRMAAGRANFEPLRPVEPYDFLMKEKLSIVPGMRGILDFSKEKRMGIMRFMDFAPMVFRQLRMLFSVSREDYLRSVGPEQLLGNLVLGNLSSLSEFVSEGKSGSFFYYTSDGKYMIKTVTEEHALFLRRWLPHYYEHCTKNPSTLLTRFYGFHAMRIKPHVDSLLRNDGRRQKIHFIVMENFFHTPVEIHRRYDIKGSTFGRFVPAEKRKEVGITLKDMDIDILGDRINLGPEKGEQLMQQLKSDTAVLKEHGIMDYSLLWGIHDVSLSHDDENLEEMIKRKRHQTEKNGLKVPFHRADYCGMLSSNNQELYCFGIIDISTQWNTKKRLERAIKYLGTRNSNAVSCVNPNAYADRFLKFISDRIS